MHVLAQTSVKSIAMKTSEENILIRRQLIDTESLQIVGFIDCGTLAPFLQGFVKEFFGPLYSFGCERDVLAG